MARVVVTGGAGFLGSYLCESILGRGDDVLCVDNLATGAESNLAAMVGDSRFTLMRHDVTEFLRIDGPVDAVLHFASPASPADYLRMPIQTLKVGSLGTHNALGLARLKRARFLLASTSEVYGDPEQHPQREDYCGSTDPVGLRGVYDEAKRFAEAMTMAYHRYHGIDTGIARIFNTYGPRMRPDDGRVVSNFVTAALGGRPLVVLGDGSQTRSFCYIDDTIRALLALMDSGAHEPVNIGNPAETTVAALADLVRKVTGSASPVVHAELPAGDPARRCPNIARARALLNWSPEVALEEGLRRTAAWFRSAQTAR